MTLNDMELVGVKWLDAKDEQGIKLQDILNNPTDKYGAYRTTYGKLAKEDSKGVVLIRDIDDDNECETTFIPKKMLVRIERGK